MRPSTNLLRTRTPFFSLTQPRHLRTTRTATRSFSLTPHRALREENESQSGAELEKAKHKQNHNKEAREKLESNSESHVKADREEVKDHDQHMEELQKEGAAKGEQEKGK